MNTQSTGSWAKVSAVAFGIFMLGQTLQVQAATITWGGSDGEYATGANWIGGNTPNLNGTGDTARITAGNVTYTAGGDLFISGGSTLQISGGSWIQAGGIAYMQMGGGTILIDGGTFSQGTSGEIVRNASSAITVTSGIANFNGNFLYNTSVTGAFTLSGGTVNVANEFKPIESFSLSGGTLNATLISFADGPGTFNLSGGMVSVDGSSFYSGFYGGVVDLETPSNTKGLNFTTGSTGSVYFRNYTIADLTDDGFMSNGTFQINGSVAFLTDYNITETGGGVLISLAAVPEPSTYALMALGLGSLWVLRRKKAKA